MNNNIQSDTFKLGGKFAFDDVTNAIHTVGKRKMSIVANEKTISGFRQITNTEGVAVFILSKYGPECGEIFGVPVFIDCSENDNEFKVVSDVRDKSIREENRAMSARLNGEKIVMNRVFDKSSHESIKEAIEEIRKCRVLKGTCYVVVSNFVYGVLRWVNNCFKSHGFVDTFRFNNQDDVFESIDGVFIVKDEKLDNIDRFSVYLINQGD